MEQFLLFFLEILLNQLSEANNFKSINIHGVVFAHIKWQQKIVFRIQTFHSTFNRIVTIIKIYGANDFVCIKACYTAGITELTELLIFLTVVGKRKKTWINGSAVFLSIIMFRVVRFYISRVYAKQYTYNLVRTIFAKQ